MPLEKETTSFTDSVGKEHEYDIFTLKTISKYVLTVKSGYPLSSITLHDNSVRINLPETLLSYEVARIINEFVAHVLSLRSA